MLSRTQASAVEHVGTICNLIQRRDYKTGFLSLSADVYISCEGFVF